MQWEYLCIEYISGHMVEIEKELNALGLYGWELCAIYDNHLYLKRQVEIEK